MLVIMQQEGCCPDSPIDGGGVEEVLPCTSAALPTILAPPLSVGSLRTFFQPVQFHF